MEYSLVMQAMHAFLITTRCSNVSLSMDKYSQRILSIPNSGFFQAVKNDSRFITSILRYIEMKEIYQDYVPRIKNLLTVNPEYWAVILSIPEYIQKWSQALLRIPKYL